MCAAGHRVVRGCSGDGRVEMVIDRVEHLGTGNACGALKVEAQPLILVLEPGQTATPRESDASRPHSGLGSRP